MVSAPGAPGAIQAYMEIKCEPVNTDEDPPEGPRADPVGRLGTCS